MSTATQELIIAWLIFPALLIAVSVYLGLAVFRFSHLGLKNPFVLPTGFAALIVVGQIATMNSKVASKSPLVFSVITLMCALYFGTDFFAWLKDNVKALALGGLVFYMHGLPILMTKTPTFAGWIKLDDGSSWLAITDQMLLAGRDNSILNPSSHEAIVQILLNPARGDLPYPSGSFIPLGIFSKWLFIDPAWTIQPYMAAVNFDQSGILIGIRSLRCCLVSRFWHSLCRLKFRSGQNSRLPLLLRLPPSFMDMKCGAGSRNYYLCRCLFLLLP